MKWYLYYIDDYGKTTVLREFDNRQDALESKDNFEALKKCCLYGIGRTYRVGNDFDLVESGVY